MVPVGAYYGKNISFESQWPLYEALRTTASIIFAVTGAWFAIIFPEKFKSSFSRSKEEGKRVIDEKVFSSRNINKIFSPIVHSTIMLCLVLFIGVVAPVTKQVGFLSEHAVVMRSISYGFLVFLTLWQIWTVFLTLMVSGLVKENMDRKNNFESAVSRFSENRLEDVEPSVSSQRENNES